MVSASGQRVLVFNGEIYNFTELHAELEQQGRAPAWRGHSDTETMLAAFEAWGVEQTLKRARGMFALALWDRQNRTLTLARDRLGEKPLYYGWQMQGQQPAFLFGSELKALREHPSFAGEVDRSSVCLLLRHNCVPGLAPGSEGRPRPGCNDRWIVGRTSSAHRAPGSAPGPRQRTRPPPGRQ